MSPMDRALAEARAAAARGEVPVGAVITDAAGQTIAAAGNAVEAAADPTAHAEMLALRAAAGRRAGKYLADCTLTVTLEPWRDVRRRDRPRFRVGRLVFGAYDPKSGAIEHGPRLFTQPTTHHRPEIIGGVRDSECGALLQAFFAGLRDAPFQT